MLVLDEKSKLNRRIFEQVLVHFSFDSIVHLECDYLVTRCLSRILSQGVRASPLRRLHNVDHKVDDKFDDL